MLEIFNNKEAFLKIKPRLGFIIFIFIIIALSFLLWYMYYKEIYDNFQTKGIVNCQESCQITAIIPTNINFIKIKLNNNYIKYKIANKELIIDDKNYSSYYSITLNVEEKLTNNEIVDLNFYYNKQRIINKIKNKMF